jgi:hypothetical protein
MLHALLGTFATLQKVNISIIMSVYPHATFESQWTDLHEILYQRIV